MTNEEVLRNSKKYRYMILSRLISDCRYYLGNGHRQKKYLWAGDEVEHIDMMKALYNSFSDGDKPEWISMEDIETFEREMVMIDEDEIARYLRHNPYKTRATMDMKAVKWWIEHYPVFSYISKRNASDFMENMNHVLCKAGIDMLGYIQNYNYYKKFWGEQETCKRFVKEAIKAVEFLEVNVGISQNDNEAIIILKDFA